MKIEMGKKYTYLNLPARVICVDRKDHQYPVIALVRDSTNTEIVTTFTEDGGYSDERDRLHQQAPYRSQPLRRLENRRQDFGVGFCSPQRSVGSPALCRAG